MDEKKREEIALFRYSLIVPFLSEEELEWGVKGELVKRLISEIHSIPFSKKSSLNESTIRNYLRRYRQHGFEGLKPETRSDKGQSRKIPGDILEKAFMLKKEEPRRSVRKIIQLMEAHQMAPPGLLKLSSLSSIFKAHGLTRKQLGQSKKTFRAFQAEHPNQIWQSDILYGPHLPDPDRPAAKKQTYLVALIDDFSRLVLHAEFYFKQNLPCLENTLFKALLKRGLPEVLYVDNGQVYSANQINVICAELGIRKISCRPYSPEGKGKIERFFRTLRQDFLLELEHEPVEKLKTLNDKLWAWVELEYQAKVHSATSQTPLDRWQASVGPYLKTIEEKQLQSVFLWRKNRAVNKVGLVPLEGFKFEVESFLANKTVEIRYNPFDLSKVYIYFDNRFIQTARQTRLSRWNTSKKQRRQIKNDQKSPAGVPAQSNIKHLEHLQKQHQHQKIEHAKKLLGQSQPTDFNCSNKTSFSQAHFIKTIADALGRRLEDFHAKELDAINQTWDSYGPLEVVEVTIALSKAQLEKGRNQHISYYLDRIVKQHIKHKNKE